MEASEGVTGEQIPDSEIITMFDDLFLKLSFTFLFLYFFANYWYGFVIPMAGR